MGRFDYYKKLSAADRRVYDQSDAIRSVPLPRLARHRARAARLRAALESEDRAAVEEAARELANGITLALGARGVKVRVLARRPRNRAGELHGLYTLEEDGQAHIEVWMRTAEHRRVVAFRTFLRTLAHEIGHHLDLVHFDLRETFHTEGFFSRESSLVRQLLGEDELDRTEGTRRGPRAGQPQSRPAADGAEARREGPSDEGGSPPRRASPPRRPSAGRQLSLFN